MALVLIDDIADKKFLHKHPTAVAIGNFDGFHLGHKKIIETLKTISMEKGLVSILLTFIPHPKKYFNKDISLINSTDQKLLMLDHLGLDKVFVVQFAQITNMTGDHFVREILLNKLNMKVFVIGKNFHFGKRREHNFQTLEDLSKRLYFQLSIVPPVILEGKRVSSTLVREKLIRSDITGANLMMGHPYYIDGIVTEGDRLGRKLGFPTVNLITKNEILPQGVFQTTIEFDKQTFHSITYIGSRPTISTGPKKVETHIFNFNRNIYDKKVRIFFNKKLRDEMKFKSKAGLIKQIKSDINRLNIDKGLFF
jgi:riboflavin kinase/FMN adenylyltransferase